MSVRAVARLAWGVAAALACYNVIVALRRPDLFPDLDVYRVASGTLAEHGRGLYDVVGVNGGPFTYPPIAALVLWPLRFPPMTVAGVVLAAATVAAAAATGRLCTARSATWIAPAAVAGAMWTVPFRTTIFFGQVGVLLMLLIAADLLVDTPPWPRGALIGLASAIKLTPLAFVLYLLVTRRRREAWTAMAFFAGATAVGSALLPDESHRYWVHDLWRFGRVGELNGAHNRSLWGVLGAAHVPKLVVLVAALVALGLGLWRARRLEAVGARVAALTVVGCTSCLISPITWSHHLVWLLPALAVLLSRREPVSVIAALALVIANGRFAANPRVVTLVETAATALLVLALPAERAKSSPRSVRRVRGRVGRVSPAASTRRTDAPPPTDGSPTA